MTHPVEPNREHFLDDESFDRADADYWAWYDHEESRRAEEGYR
jgi:hypothetical protein